MIPTIESIQKKVAEHYGLSVGRLAGPERFKFITHARHVAMFFVRHMTGRSYPDIGREFGDRDHTTVMHGIRKILRLMAEDQETLNELEQLRVVLGCDPLPVPKESGTHGVVLEETGT